MTAETRIDAAAGRAQLLGVMRSMIFRAMLAVLAPAPAAACLPPPPLAPGETPPPEPTREDKVRWMVRFASDIVAGEVIRSSGRHGLRFRVDHVYKGNLRRGAILKASQGWGLDAPACAGMIAPPPAWRGARGTIFFSGSPEINFVADSDLEIAFRVGLLKRAPARR